MKTCQVLISSSVYTWGYDHSNQKFHKRKKQHARAWLGRAGTHGHLLGTQLDADGSTYTLGLLPVMAGLLPLHRRSGLLADGHIFAQTQPAKIRGIVHHLCARLVDL